MISKAFFVRIKELELKKQPFGAGSTHLLKTIQAGFIGLRRLTILIFISPNLVSMLISMVNMVIGYVVILNLHNIYLKTFFLLTSKQKGRNTPSRYRPCNR